MTAILRHSAVRPFLAVLLLLVAGAADVVAQAPAAFSRLGFGARGVGLGNAVAADSAASPWYNPALAPFADRQSLSTSVGILSLDRNLQFIQVATPLQRAGIALGLTHSTVSGIDGRDNNGFHTAEYSTDEFAGFLAFGLRFSPRVTGGIGLQFFRSDLFEGLGAVNSIGIDLGVTVLVRDQTRVALVLDDLLARFSWDSSDLYSSGGKSSSDRFPRRIRLGVAQSFPKQRIRLLGEYEARFSDRERFVSDVQLLGDEPIQTSTSERFIVRSDILRFGASYEVADFLSINGGLDRTSGLGGGAFRPALGFLIEQPIGNLGTRIGYTFVSEPYGFGSAHYLALRLYLEP